MPIDNVYDLADYRSDDIPSPSASLKLAVDDSIGSILGNYKFTNKPRSNSMRPGEWLEDDESTYPDVLSDEANRSVFYALEEMQSVRDRAEKLVGLAPSELRFDQDFKFGLERIQSEIRALTESLVAEKQVKIAAGQQFQASSSIVGKAVVPEREIYSGEPEWMREVRALRSSGVIPDYQGKRKDGDAYEYYMKHYAPWKNVMNQTLLKRLGEEKLFHGLVYSAREREISISSLIPASNK